VPRQHAVIGRFARFRDEAVRALSVGAGYPVFIGSPALDSGLPVLGTLGAGILRHARQLHSRDAGMACCVAVLVMWFFAEDSRSAIDIVLRP